MLRKLRPIGNGNRQRQQFCLTENAKYLNIYLVQKAKIFNEITKIFKKYLNYQAKNGNFFEKSTKTFKSIKTYSKIFSVIKVKKSQPEKRN